MAATLVALVVVGAVVVVPVIRDVTEFALLMFLFAGI
jgi:hypothetical protein